METREYGQQSVVATRAKLEVSRYERYRLISHLGKTFARRYNIQVLPSGQKGLWACGLDPKATPELQKYVGGQRDTLDDLPPESFTPKQILYDEESAAEMSMEEVNTVFHHEAGYAKYTDFKSMFWDYVINRDTTNGAERILQGDPIIEQDIRRIYDVIRVANRLRDMYEAYQTGDSNEPMDFPTSLREVTDIVMEMNHRQGVKPIIKRVIVPKIDDIRQKRLVGQTIDALLPD